MTARFGRITKDLSYRLALVVAMLTRITVLCILLLILGTIADGNAASTLRMTCSGNLTNTRADGVTLGQCDLNFLPVKAMTEIENVCGIPGKYFFPSSINSSANAVLPTNETLV